MTCLATHPDGVRVLAVDEAALLVLDPTAGEALARLPAEARPLTHVLAHADGRVFVTGSAGACVLRVERP